MAYRKGRGICDVKIYKTSAMLTKANMTDGYRWKRRLK